MDRCAGRCPGPGPWPAIFGVASSLHAGPGPDLAVGVADRGTLVREVFPPLRPLRESDGATGAAEDHCVGRPGDADSTDTRARLTGPRDLSRRCEELQGDVVWVSERQARPIGRVDYPAVGDPKGVQMRFPLSKLGPVRTTKRDVVKARPQLIERLCTRWGGMLVNAEQRAAKEPHDVVERAGVLVEHRIGAEQSLIPRPAPIKISDRHGDMRNRGKLSHHVPNSFETYSTRRVVALLGHFPFGHTRAPSIPGSATYRTMLQGA
jgi:hypothetical protein